LLVTISGLPGAGTSTVAAQVAAALGLERLDGGSAWRALAAERGMSLAEFGALAEGDASIDLALDARLAARAGTSDLVLESRLAGWIAFNRALPSLRVWIGCDESERARRVAGRDGADLDAALAGNRRREASERQRYRAYYEIDLADLGIYDLVLDSTVRPPDDLIAEIVAAAHARFS